MTAASPEPQTAAAIQSRRRTAEAMLGRLRETLRQMRREHTSITIAAIARQASPGVVRIQPLPGRMVAFPGWLPHSVQATLSGGGLRICVAWNVAYDKTWKGMS